MPQMDTRGLGNPDHVLPKAPRSVLAVGAGNLCTALRISVCPYRDRPASRIPNDHAIPRLIAVQSNAASMNNPDYRHG
jgi:hypothetical protein